MNSIDFEQELYKHFGQNKDFALGMRIGKYFYELGKQSGSSEIPKDLEEAAKEMAIRAFPEKKSYSTVIDRVVDYNAVDRKNYRDGIIAGAKWDRSQIMKGAVKWLVDDDYHEATDKGRFILGSVGIGYNGYYIPYSDLLKLPKED